MRLNSDDKTVAAMDLLVPKVGELIGGSQREERLQVLSSFSHISTCTFCVCVHICLVLLSCWMAVQVYFPVCRNYAALGFLGKFAWLCAQCLAGKCTAHIIAVSWVWLCRSV